MAAGISVVRTGCEKRWCKSIMAKMEGRSHSDLNWQARREISEDPCLQSRIGEEVGGDP